jgi:signal transduction histidine kinase
MKGFRERKLLWGFGVFMVLTISIGVIGIFRIYSLTETIQKLGQIHLRRGRIILEMKINNALYAMGVRNYVFWRMSKYLPAASIASDINFIKKSSATFREYLNMYHSLAVRQEEKQWGKELESLIKELEYIGGRLVNLVDSSQQDKERINKLLMAFENKFYGIDDFLAENLSKSNLKDIERQIELAKKQKDMSILILTVSLLFSIALGVGITYFVYSSLREERQRRELLVQRMISLEEEERKNLSRQIHDQLSQDLSALKIYLELIEKNIPATNNEDRDKIEKSKNILSNLIDRGHNISELLRPPELDDLGLIESIASLVSEHQEITGCSYSYHKPPSEINLTPEYSLALYRVAQEALTNIVKHARATNITLSLQKRGNTIHFTIIDDGIGFDYHQYLKRPRRRKEDKLKLGLQGLRERIELLGGKMFIKTAPGKGTRIEVELSC